MLKNRLELRSAASAIGVRPSFTGISSSQNAGIQRKTAADVYSSAPLKLRLQASSPAENRRGPHSSEYQTRQSRAGCAPGGKEFAYAFLGVPFSSNGPGCVPECVIDGELPLCCLACRR